MRRVAAIDVGSNATRLTTVRISATGVASHWYTRRYPLRLGQDVFSQGFVGEAKARELLLIFAQIANVLREQKIDSYRAVATAAMREAGNALSLIQTLHEQHGMVLELITGEEESRLARQALLRSVGPVPGETLLIDLGGGSLELVRASTDAGVSLPLGTVRLLEQFPALQKPMSQAAVNQLQQVFSNKLKAALPNAQPTALAIGTGGNLDVLNKLVGDFTGRLPKLQLAELLPLAYQLAGATPEERASLYRLRPDRADIILPAVLMMLAVVDVFDIKHLVVPSTGLRDAVLADLLLLNNQSCSWLNKPDWASVHVEAWQHAVHAKAVAQQLFNDLASLHGLWPSALPLLKLALDSYYKPTNRSPAGSPSKQLDSRACRVVKYLWSHLHRRPLLASAQPIKSDTVAARVLLAIAQVAVAAAACEESSSLLQVDLLPNPWRIEANSSSPALQQAVVGLSQALHP